MIPGRSFHDMKHEVKRSTCEKQEATFDLSLVSGENRGPLFGLPVFEADESVPMADVPGRLSGHLHSSTSVMAWFAEFVLSFPGRCLRNFRQRAQANQTALRFDP